MKNKTIKTLSVVGGLLLCFGLIAVLGSSFIKIYAEEEEIYLSDGVPENVFYYDGGISSSFDNEDLFSWYYGNGHPVLFDYNIDSGYYVSLINNESEYILHWNLFPNFVCARMNIDTIEEFNTGLYDELLNVLDKSQDTYNYEYLPFSVGDYIDFMPIRNENIKVFVSLRQFFNSSVNYTYTLFNGGDEITETGSLTPDESGNYLFTSPIVKAGNTLRLEFDSRSYLINAKAQKFVMGYC